MAAISDLNAFSQILTALPILEFKEEDPDQLPCETVVERMDARQNREIEKMRPSDSRFFFILDNQEKETFLRSNREFIQRINAFEAAGGLPFGLEYRFIAGFVQQKFDALREAGILMSRAEFEEKETPALFRTLGKITVPGQRSGDLERLWGAEYLRNQFKAPGYERFRVPRYVVVLENKVTQLPVKVTVDSSTLFIKRFDIRLGEILAENIDGKEFDCQSDEFRPF